MKDAHVVGLEILKFSIIFFVFSDFIRGKGLCFLDVVSSALRRASSNVSTYFAVVAIFASPSNCWAVNIVNLAS